MKANEFLAKYFDTNIEFCSLYKYGISYKNDLEGIDVTIDTSDSDNYRYEFSPIEKIGYLVEESEIIDGSCTVSLDGTRITGGD